MKWLGRYFVEYTEMVIFNSCKYTNTLFVADFVCRDSLAAAVRTEWRCVLSRQCNLHLSSFMLYVFFSENIRFKALNAAAECVLDGRWCACKCTGERYEIIIQSVITYQLHITTRYMECSINDNINASLRRLQHNHLDNRPRQVQQVLQQRPAKYQDNHYN